MDYIELNRLLHLYDHLFDDIYERYLYDFCNDKNLLYIQEIDYVSSINFIRRCKGFLAFTDVDELKSYIIDVCFLYEYWTQIRCNDGYSMGKLDDTIKNTISHLKIKKQHIIDFIVKESRQCIDLLLSND